MCTRQKALQYVITNGSGSKSDLVNCITERQYDEFVSVGLIREPVKMSVIPRVVSLEIGSKDWVATPLAFKRAVELNLKAVRGLRFKTKTKGFFEIITGK